MEWTINGFEQWEAGASWSVVQIDLEHGTGWLPELYAIAESTLEYLVSNFVDSMLSFATLYFRYWANVGNILSGTEWILLDTHVYLK